MINTPKINQKFINKLELFKGLLWHDKADILLTAIDLKPTVFTHLYTDNYALKDKPLRVQKSAIVKLASILENLGLKYSTRKRVLVHDELEQIASHVVDFFIGRTYKDVQTLKQAVVDWDEKLIGITLGYPETAVKAYISGNLLEIMDHPRSTPEVSEDNMNMLNHRLSEANWREEVKYLQTNGEALAVLSPEIYKHVIV